MDCDFVYIVGLFLCIMHGNFFTPLHLRFVSSETVKKTKPLTSGGVFELENRKLNLDPATGLFYLREMLRTFYNLGFWVS